MPRGRKKVPAQRIAIRVNPGDKEYLDEKAEVEGTTISEICRHWINDRIRHERSLEANVKASQFMEQFFGKVMDEMVDQAVPPGRIEAIIGLGAESSSDLLDVLPEPEPRPSNTGAISSKSVTGQKPRKLKKAS